MDIGNIEAMRNLTESESDGIDISRHLDGLQRYIETGEQYFFTLINNKEFDAFLNLLGIQEVNGNQVMLANYRNTAEYVDERIKESSRFISTDTFKTCELFEIIADRYANRVEFVNNFKVDLAVKLDDDTSMLLQYECDEQPGICNDCYDDPDYMEFDSNYPCDHGIPDDFTYRYSALIISSDDLEEEFHRIW